MELFMDILCKAMGRKGTDLAWPYFQVDASQLVELVCYQALREIKAILEDEDLEDCECFMKIEKIVRILEQMGSNGGFRHDFG